jgi:RecB family endonuclease NucS
LYWRKKNKETIPVNVRPFTTEEEFEQTVFDTPAVLGDIYLLKRQVRGGGKPGIPDIIGVDAQGKVCVVEMKNTSVDASVIPQVLGYAIWAESRASCINASR